jgi:hypothetical protein
MAAENKQYQSYKKLSVVKYKHWDSDSYKFFVVSSLISGCKYDITAVEYNQLLLHVNLRG